MKHDFSQLISHHKEILLQGFSGASLAQVLGRICGETHRPLLLIVEDQRRAELLADEIHFFLRSERIRILPAYDVKPYYGLSPHRRIILENLEILYLLLQKQVDVVIAPQQAVMRRLVPRQVFAGLMLTIAKKDLIDREELIQSLTFMGYERQSLVEDPGQFAVRGDIIDIFSPQEEAPFRVSLFDIEVEDIKTFEPATQRTLHSVPEIRVIPACEIFLNMLRSKDLEEGQGGQTPEDKFPLINQQWKSDLKKKTDARDLTKYKRDQIEEFVNNKIYFHGIDFFLPLFYRETSSLFDYLSPQTLIVLDLDNPIEKYVLHHLEDMQTHHADSDHIESIFSPTELFLTVDETLDRLRKFTCLYHRDILLDLDASVPRITGDTESNQVLKTKIAARISQVHNMAPLVSEINQKRLEGYACFIVCKNEVQLDRIRDLLKRFELPLRTSGPDLTPSDSDRLITLMVGEIHEGFLSHEPREWWITDEEIFGKKTRRAVSQKQQTVVFSSFADLSQGDYIIHMDHGVGIYHGLVKLDYDVHKNDFMHLEYLGGDRLYVPTDRLNRVQRFVAEEGATPQLDKLGGTTWLKTRTKAKRAARKLAKELLLLQAKRASLKGYGFQEHQEDMEEFASTFEFEETVDQLATIAAVLKDMDREQPMDRLVCGDVGYGKTEVAIRAAFKAVLDHKQVAILVPTTVLAFQHFNTFSERLKNYPVKMGLLSRFRSPQEQQDVVRLLKSGGIDIVVGTHRLLSKDIKFSDLGLLVIDEEHRFGVTHKEKIKSLKNLVDVVTLTATPIPRTLNFALNGIRDLSIINTPPVDRLAIRTYTCYFDEVTIRDAILKEVRRGGQVYFVHNRVQSIERMTTQLSKLIPEARFRFAHGQMEEGDLEQIMIDFMHHEFDVLVCTTIIESGLDIPNANTMVINRADGFGLAQLYQLRGRVGRSSRQAYCYLVIPLESLITNKAKKRLAAIQKFTELGSGFKVASRDLEIRGAGNILGEEQSGHIAAIGYDLYINLLQQAVNELKNTAMPEDFEPEISLNIPAKIPDELISDQQLRLILYKQASSCEDEEMVTSLQEEWEDRFGKLPDEMLHLLGIIRIKILCKKVLVSEIKYNGDHLLFSFCENHQIDTQIFIEAIKRHPHKFSITRDGRFMVKDKYTTDHELLRYVGELLGKMAASLS